MSVLLNSSFVLFGILALATIVASLRRYAPLFADLHRQLGAPEGAREIRFTLIEPMLVRLRANRGPLRHQHRRKPVMHRLHGRAPRRAAA